VLTFDEPFLRLYNHGMVNDSQGRKQSKSLGNVVEPTAVMDQYGADALRVYLLFVTAFNVPIDWNEEGPKDALAYLQRVHRIVSRHADTVRQHPGMLFDAAVAAADPARTLRRVTHETIQRVTADVENFRFNTAIAQLMILTNELSTLDEAVPAQATAASLRTLVRLLALFAPHFAEEAWGMLGGEGLVAQATWPEVDAAALVSEVKNIAVQVNGKFAAELSMARTASEEDILREALANPHVDRRLQGKSVRRVIHVRDRLVNLVVS
jgi:leucyl-tRNA synthetase